MIEGQLILHEIKQIIPNAVIAGGYIRDNHSGVQFKDVDVFFPMSAKEIGIPRYSNGKYSYPDHLLKKLGDELVKTNSNFIAVDQDVNLIDYGIIRNFAGMRNFTYRGTIPVQLVAYTLPAENFAENLVKEFQFDIDRCYYDGLDTIITPEAQQDLDYHKITLSRLDNGLADLPRAMKKFFRLQEKYPNHYFYSTILEWNPKGKKIRAEEYFVTPIKNAMIINAANEIEPVAEDVGLDLF